MAALLRLRLPACRASHYLARLAMVLLALIEIAVPPPPAAAQPPASETSNADTWSAVGNLAIARNGHTATLLPSGKVLVAGGWTGKDSLASAELYDPATGTFTTTGSLNTARAIHTATLLPSGQVLITGGWTGRGSLTTAELYDPATGTFTTTGSLNFARQSHTATLLPSGRVLVAGGSGKGGGRPASAELYDPATGTFTTTGSLNFARAYHTATLLPSGKVLVAGGWGWGYSNPLSSAELYDPATETWSTTDSLGTTRASHTATLLPDGQVLVAGGIGGSHWLASAELYNPATETFTTTGSLNFARAYHTATLLPSGQVLVAGGFGGIGLASAELYDPAGKAWTQTGNLSKSHTTHTATLLPSGQVLVAGGMGAGYYYTKSAELYDSASGTFTPTGSLNIARSSHTATLLPNGHVLIVGGWDSTKAGGSTNTYPKTAEQCFNKYCSLTRQLNTGREYATATLLPNEQVLVVGGCNSIPCGFLSSAELYNPHADFMNQFNVLSGAWSLTGNLLTGRRAHTATLLPNGKVLVAGGQGNNGYLTSAELYDPATKMFTLTGSLKFARGWHTATLLPSGKVLVAGGQDNNGSIASAELYDPATGTFTTTGSLKSSRQGHTATLLPSGKVLVAGGQGNNGSIASAELYDPRMGDSGAWIPTSDLLTGRRAHTATLLPSGKVLVAGGQGNNGYLTSAELYDPATRTFTTTNSLKFARSSHTATLLPNGQVLVAGGSGDSGSLTSAELYSTGSSDAAAWRPELAGTPNPQPGSALVVDGSDFRGYSYTEASSGATNDSATNYPLAQLRRLDNEQTQWLLPDPAHPFTARQFTSRALADFPDGHALMTVFVNGIASEAQIVRVGAREPGTLNIARLGHTATLLPNGRVLVAGGRGNSGILMSAELYDPATGIFTPTGSLNIARLGHTATLLPNGLVLVAGGRGKSGSLTSTELYNPATGIFTPTGSLNIARSSHTATLLPNGLVLVVDGDGSYDELPSAELYDPVTGQWTLTDSLHQPHHRYLTGGHLTATLLPNRLVLVVGGWGGRFPPTHTPEELYDPATRQWTLTNFAMGTRELRHSHTATLLPNGKVLIVGGYGPWLCCGRELASAEIYDPAAGAFTLTGSLNFARAWHTATLLPSGEVLAVGGSCNVAIPLNTAEVYYPSQQAFVTTGTLNFARLGHTATLLPNGRVLVLGGCSAANCYLAGYLPWAEQYDPASGKWALIGP